METRAKEVQKIIFDLVDRKIKNAEEVFDVVKDLNKCPGKDEFIAQVHYQLLWKMDNICGSYHILRHLLWLKNSCQRDNFGTPQWIHAMNAEKESCITSLIRGAEFGGSSSGTQRIDHAKELESYAKFIEILKEIVEYVSEALPTDES